MKRYLEEQLDIRDVPGICVSYRDGSNREILSAGRGAGPDRAFDIGSVAKTAAATEIFMQAERGETELSEDILRMLSHTSGMRDEGGPLWDPSENIFCYCNRAYDMLIDEYLGGRITVLKESGLPRAEAYEKDENRNHVRVEGNDGYCSDIYLLTEYAEKHLKKEFLSEEYYDLMWKKRALVPDSGEHISCGWFVVEKEGVTYYGHEGGAEGCRSSLYLSPEAGRYVIVLANCGWADTKKLAFGILSRL